MGEFADTEKDCRLSIKSDIPQKLELDNALWRFAGHFWSRPRVEQACLALQSRGWSVSRVLCAAWLTQEKRIYNGKDCVNVIEWRKRVTEVLRTARLAIPKDNPATDAVRNQIAQSELGAEKVELAIAFHALTSGQERSDNSWSTTTTALAQENFRAAAPETTMDNETGRLLETLISELTHHIADGGGSCS